MNCVNERMDSSRKYCREQLGIFHSVNIGSLRSVLLEQQLLLAPFTALNCCYTSTTERLVEKRQIPLIASANYLLWYVLNAFQRAGAETPIECVPRRLTRPHNARYSVI